jgi:flagellar M-ring protein FliF
MAISDFSSQIKTLFTSLSPAKRFTLIGFAVATFAGFIFLATWSGSPDYQLLYSNLSPEDGGAIISALKERKIAYKMTGDGNAIMIPGKQIHEVRLDLASSGLPRGSGIGFEIFDNTKLGMTEFVQNVNYQRALQGELSRTINGFDEVESTRVHIVMPSKSLFLEDETPASASIIVKLRPGRWLKRPQVQAVVHLVSSSVSGLNPENVTIVDNYGKMLAGNEADPRGGTPNSDQLALQEKIERGMESRIQAMLEKPLGPGKTTVKVACELDFKRQERTEEKFIPDKNAVRSEQVFNESSGSGTGPSGVPGVLSNTAAGDLTGEEGKNNSGASDASGDRFHKQERTINYEISKVTSHTIEPFAAIKRLSVAVIVDGTRKLAEKGKGAKGADKGEETVYVPRTAEEMQKLERIVKRAVNFDPGRGDEVEVVNIPFEPLKIDDTDENQDEKGWMAYVEKYAPSTKNAFMGLFFILLFFFVVRPLIRWLTSNPAKGGQMLKQLPKTLEEMESEYGRSLPYRDKALSLIEKDQDRNLALLKGWLNEKEA